MLNWLLRGIRGGRITTRYPQRAELPPDGFHARVEVLRDTDGDGDMQRLCPTGAITVDDGHIRLDHGRCILCGECVRLAGEHFGWYDGAYETASRSRDGLLSDAAIEDHVASRPSLGELGSALRRSIHVRHIDCGSDGSEEWEIQALWNPYYDIQRLGFFLTSAPRHADILLVTGGVTEPMRGPLKRTWQVMPAPKVLVAVGTDACSGGLAADSGLIAGGVDQVLPVDVYVPGSPPAPIAIMHGLLQAVGIFNPEQVA
jgi:Ni,Fe-hydrogenase III small subunit/ferredoxin